MNRAFKKLALGLTIIVLLFGTLLYPYLLYTDNAFVSKWRTLYIETAMSTMNHQWLATAFIPKELIDEVMAQRYASDALQDTVESDWSQVTTVIRPSVTQVGGGGTAEETDELDELLALFPELDEDSFVKFAEKHPSAVSDGYMELDIDWCKKSEDTGIVTTEGDPVLAINTEHKIMIIGVSGDGYEGKMAIVKDASLVEVGLSKNFLSSGQHIADLAARYDAICAINASGFEDYEGTGNGGVPYGYVKSQGERKYKTVGGAWKIIGFDEDDQLNIGSFSDPTFLRDAVEFRPALIVNGKNMGASGWGVQPRTCIGQTADKTVLMLVIDGRQTHSIGATLEQCTDILLRYGAVQASNLDGGSSSVMYYNGRVITSPTTASMNGKGRYLPDAFIVR
jgi:exopolysaccharide biosynthesis protein